MWPGLHTQGGKDHSPDRPCPPPSRGLLLQPSAFSLGCPPARTGHGEGAWETRQQPALSHLRCSHLCPGRGRQTGMPLSHPPSCEGCRRGPGVWSRPHRRPAVAQALGKKPLPSLPLFFYLHSGGDVLAPLEIVMRIRFCSLINELLTPSSRHPVSSFAWGQSVSPQAPWEF